MTPRLYTLARPTFDVAEVMRFLKEEHEEWQRTDNAHPGDNLVEIAGRICYMSFGERQSPRDNAAYIRNLIGNGHESVLEHASWSFILADVSRSFTHQLVRHRVGFSYSQLSQQYHNEEDAETLIPSLVREDPELASRWETVSSAAADAYREIISSLESRTEGLPDELSKKERGRLIRSAARGILPGNTATKIFVTANARALRHFFKLRGSLEGDEEMRLVSTALYEVVHEDAPALFADFTLDRLSDGSPVLRSVH